ncbi:pathogen-associated molecular patterns-induced protein A70 [Argentina anserina]|uniref:pathogen-associated molecular patterns-induced protein A70 n=1 Tax=Argentina anserina TaxID=57926 RepID=UPI0021762860|nr:pathogen-associated molecular patterns-induced protein A70 [Potentilla anserina]
MFEESVSALPSIWASMNSWLTPTVLFLLLNLIIGTIAIASSLGTQMHHDQDQHQHQQHQGLVRSSSVLQRFKSINFYSYRSPEPATNYERAPESETHEVEQHKLHRSPSMLQRLQSIKFQFQFPREPSPLQTRDLVVPGPEPETHFTTFEHSPEDESEKEEEEEEEGQHEELELDDEDQFEVEAGGEEEDQTLDQIYRQLQLQDHHVTRTTSDTLPAPGEVPTKLPKKMKKSASTKSAFSHFAAEDIVEKRRPETVREKKAAKADEDDEEVDAKADDFINRFKQQLKLQRLDSVVRYKDMISRGSDNK